MPHLFFSSAAQRLAFLVTGAAALPVVAQAQPTITSTTPGANARAASPTAAVAVTFSQPLLATAGPALRVYSAQRGGLRSRGAATASVAGNALQFSPGATPFLPGETVQASVTTAAASSSGSLARGRVLQFTAAVRGTGPAAFQAGTNLTVDGAYFAEAVGDVDGDGDLDLVTGSYLGSANVLLNGGNASGSNTGVFSNGSSVAIGPNPFELALGDVDGDGDLDLVTASNSGSNRASVRLNGGDASGSNTGVFSGGTDVAVDGQATGLTLADVDGDGDLDLLVVTTYANDSQVSVRLNGGDASGSNTGTFSNGSAVPVASNPFRVLAGDVDNDGDLDLLTTHFATGRVSVRLNGGDNSGSNTGTFGNGSEVLTNSSPYGMALGDVDGDGDLDIVATGYSDNLVSVRLNGGNNAGGGTGTFTGGSQVSVGNNPLAVALGDLDGDGDLDLVTANSLGNSLSVRLNGGSNAGGGTGTFSGGSTLTGANDLRNVVLRDLDGDGDLDLVASGSNVVSIRLNQSAQALATVGGAATPAASFTVFPTVAEAGSAPRYHYAGPLAGATLTVCNAQGWPVRTLPLNGAGTGALSTEGLAAGWYFVQLSAPGQHLTTRVCLP